MNSVKFALLAAISTWGNLLGQEADDWWKELPSYQLLLRGSAAAGSEMDPAVFEELRSRPGLAEELIADIEAVAGSNGDPEAHVSNFISVSLSGLYTVATMTPEQETRLHGLIHQAWSQWKSDRHLIKSGSWQEGLLMALPSCLGRGAPGPSESIFLEMLSDHKYEYGIGLGIVGVRDHPTQERLSAIEQRMLNEPEAMREVVEETLRRGRVALPAASAEVHGSRFPSSRGVTGPKSQSSPPQQPTSYVIALCAFGLAIAALVAAFWPRRPRK